MGVDQERTYDSIWTFLGSFRGDVVDLGLAGSLVRGARLGILLRSLLRRPSMRALLRPVTRSSAFEAISTPRRHWRACLHWGIGRSWLAWSLIVRALHLGIVLLGLIILALILIVATVVVALELGLLLSGALCRTVLKILWSRKPRAGVAARLLRLLFALLFLHLATSILRHDSSVYQVLAVRKGMVHKLVPEWIDQAFEETVLLLGVGVNLLWTVAGQL